MKYLYITLALCLAACVASKPRVVKTETFEFTHVDTLVANKEEIYAKSKMFVVDFYQSAKSVLELDDKSIGRIVAKGVLPLPVKSLTGGIVGNDRIYFTLTVDFKDNKARLHLDNFYHEGGVYACGLRGEVQQATSWGPLNSVDPPPGNQLWRVKYWAKIKKYASEQSEQIIKSFSERLHAKLPKDEY